MAWTLSSEDSNAGGSGTAWTLGHDAVAGDYIYLAVVYSNVAAFDFTITDEPGFLAASGSQIGNSGWYLTTVYIPRGEFVNAGAGVMSGTFNAATFWAIDMLGFTGDSPPSYDILQNEITTATQNIEATDGSSGATSGSVLGGTWQDGEASTGDILWITPLAAFHATTAFAINTDSSDGATEGVQRSISPTGTVKIRQRMYYRTDEDATLSDEQNGPTIAFNFGAVSADYFTLSDPLTLDGYTLVTNVSPDFFTQYEYERARARALPYYLDTGWVNRG